MNYQILVLTVNSSCFRKVRPHHKDIVIIRHINLHHQTLQFLPAILPGDIIRTSGHCSNEIFADLTQCVERLHCNSISRSKDLLLELEFLSKVWLWT